MPSYFQLTEYWRLDDAKITLYYDGLGFKRKIYA